MSALQSRLDLYKKRPGLDQKSTASAAPGLDTEGPLTGPPAMQIAAADYESTAALAKESPAIVSADPGTAASLVSFGAYGFEILAPGFLIARLRRPLAGIQMGRSRLGDYAPFSVSSILELSSIHHPEAVHPRDILFLDTETTGLSRGVATIPFLIGLAWLDGDALVTELLFIQEPGGEAACLDYLSALWQRFSYMVSYNGKSFDIPLIRNRMILHRRRGLSIGLHFDMLHIMRRLFVRGSVAGYKQGDLERELLGHERTADLPGERIPQIYFDYVKYGRDAGLKSVFQHNDWDLQGLVLLFLEAVRLYNQRDEAELQLRSGLARILMRNQDDEGALALLLKSEQEAEVSDSLPLDIRYRDRLLLARIHRRRGSWALAADVFAGLVADYNCPWSRMYLARLQEHRLGEPGLALENILFLEKQLYQTDLDQLTGAERSDMAYVMGSIPIQNRAFSRSALQHRIARLERKMNQA
ncbi:MAG: ribonuclease H-like domain-containing protein [Leptospiraceae bacterium]|nr:ribonuclease H-like domain-containing protein [Leptospiraceae bacterium]